MKSNHKIKPLTLLLSVIYTQCAMASGYHFGTQSVTAQSTANAAAAEADNASTIFSNPAGLAYLDKNQVTATLNLVMPTIKYSNAKAYYYQGSEVSGKDNGKITKDAVFAPHAYGAYKLNDRTTLGLGIYIPFASKTEYSKDSKLRYNFNQLGLTTVDIEPSIAFKVTPKHSIGAGLIAQYSKAELRKYSDWSARYTDTQLAALKAAGRIPTTDRAAFDGHAEAKGDDWAFGYHIGWLYEPNERIRVGAAYRSKVEHKLHGTTEWKADGAIAQQLYPSSISQPVSILSDGSVNPNGGKGYLPSENASIKLITPESASVHGMYKATDKLNIFGDVTWTRHSRFNEASLVFDNQKATISGQPSNSNTIRPKWRDTYKVALGGSYQLSEPLQLRAGVAFDKSPVRNAKTRMHTMPDGNRMWYSVGLKYDFKKGHSLDMAYSHIHINDTRFEAEAAPGNDVDSKGATSAEFNNYANILGIQYTYKF